MYSRRSYLRQRSLYGVSFWGRIKHFIKEKKILKYAIWSFGIGIVIFYFAFIFGMPSIRDIQTSFKESSIIYDKNGGQLYTIYGGDENRQYVNYSEISHHMTDSLVAMEDQRFFSNLGFDFIGIIRTALTCSSSGVCGGGSSLSQQLIKNTLLTDERSIKRKIREIILAFELNIRFSKEKILELYMNKISFGSNSYGVEQASRRFFGKSAKDINVLESAILGSLPKSPTAYNPYSRRDRLMGYVYFNNVSPKGEGENTEVKISATTYPGQLERFKSRFAEITFTSDGDDTSICNLTAFQVKSPFQTNKDCKTIAKKDLLEFLNSLQINDAISAIDNTGTPTSIVMEYQAGRKDRVLMRMYEDGYINDAELRDALNQGFSYTFRDPKESIKYPHFVFYIREYLVNIYGEDFFNKGGWKIYTTLDPVLQDFAQQTIDSYAKTTFANYGINNGALVALDTNTREVLAMVGSQDYFNKTIDGEVNIITSLKQPGSSMKPFIYGRAFEKNALSTDTPIFDVDMNFGTYNPKNFDGKFLGPMTIRTALDASRNIPAIKMFYLATQDETSTGAEQEYNLVEYLRNMGLTTIEHKPDNQLYGPPIALGSAEVRPIDFSAAYAAMANNGQYLKPNPIAYILDSQGNQITIDQEAPRQVMVPGAAYMITHILSDNDARPPGWNNFLALANNRKAAVKTGTSSKKVGEATFPRDLWTVGYTPQITATVWTGNTDGKTAAARASGMESSALIWKKFMDFAHKDLPKKDFVRPDDVGGNDVFLYIQNQKPTVLKSFNPEKIQIDTLCNGKVNDQTPKAAIRDAFILDAAFPIEDTHPAWRESVNAWLGSEDGRSYLIEKLGITENMMMVVAPPENICDRPTESVPQFTSTLTDGMELFSGLYPIEIEYRSEHPLKEVQVIINDVFYRSTDLGNKKEGKAKTEFNVTLNEGVNQVVTLRVVDTFGFSTSRNYNVKILDKDDEKPIIKSDTSLSLSVSAGEVVKIAGSISDISQIPKIQVFVDNIIYGTFTDTKKYSITFETPKDLARGKHDITIQATDFQKNISNLSYEVIVR